MAGESAAGRVAQALRQRLLNGDLRPGTRLSQQQIATEYGVSRRSARDALQALASEGLVDISATTGILNGLVGDGTRGAVRAAREKADEPPLTR